MLASRRWVGGSMLVVAAAAAFGFGLQDPPFPALDAFLTGQGLMPPPLWTGPASVNLDLADSEIPGTPPASSGAPRLLVLINGRQVYVDEAPRPGSSSALAGDPWRGARPEPTARSARNLIEGPVWDAPSLSGGGGLVRVSVGRLHLPPPESFRPARKTAAPVRPSPSPTHHLVATHHMPAHHPHPR